MRARADAVVVGGGIMGASVARFLTKVGYGEIALVERSSVCGGSTQYSAAHVRQHYTNEVAIRLAVRAVEMFANAEEALGGPVGFVQDGYMVLAPEEQADAIRAVVPLQRALGVETEILAPEEIADRWPALAVDGVALACFEERSGYADPVRTTRTLVDAARRDGLRVYEGSRVLGVTVARGRVTGVVTGEGEIATPVVVNATGPWGNEIGRMVGVEYPLRFSREHEAIFEAPRDLGPFPVLSDAVQRLYLRHYGSGKVLVGEGWPKELEPVDPDDYDDATDDAHLERMVPKLVRRVPALGPRLCQPAFGGAFVTGYSGVYDITDDWYPIVGEEEVEGFYSAFGGSGHSFKLAPAIGESLAHVIAGLEPPVDLSSLSGRRFADGRTFSSVWGPGNRA
ncbi:MAG: FAD-binding oxidoreductase [Thermoleophilia bacterium]|nr:FAD-binding oxidoreductase [Gaiellaceae bacterium]MDW8337682.1 FAD-binding oxidoreductase [Thermoleophilia bacterium]